MLQGLYHTKSRMSGQYVDLRCHHSLSSVRRTLPLLTIGLLLGIGLILSYQQPPTIIEHYNLVAASEHTL